MIARLCASIQYFLNGTQEGFLKYQQTPRRDSGDTVSSSGTRKSYASMTQELMKGELTASPSVSSSLKSVQQQDESQSQALPSTASIVTDSSEQNNKISTAVAYRPTASPSPDSSLASSACSPASSLHSASPTPSMSSLSSSSVLHSSSHHYPLNPASSGGHHQTSAASPSFLTSASPKLRTRRHNSVPLLRNIPIICEMVEEDVNCAGDGKGNSPHESSEVQGSIAQNTGSGVAASSVGKSLTNIGKRLTCPIIRINDAELDESLYPSKSCNVQVPQIVIEVTEPSEEDKDSRHTCEQNSNPLQIFNVPTIEIKTVDADDTDVEVDFDEESADIKITEKSTTEGDEYSSKNESEHARHEKCKKCGADNIGELGNREISPSNSSSSSGSLSPVELGQAIESKLATYKSCEASREQPSGEIAETTSSKEGQDKVLTSSSDENSVVNKKSRNYCEENEDDLKDRSAEVNSQRRRRKIGHVQSICSEESLKEEDCCSSGNKYQNLNNQAVATQSEGKDQPSRGSADTAIYVSHQTLKIAPSIAKSLPSPSESELEVQRKVLSTSASMSNVSLGASTRSASITTSVAAVVPCVKIIDDSATDAATAADDSSSKLSVPSLSSRKTSDESTISSSSRRTSDSSSAAPELMALQSSSATDDCSCSNVSSRRTSAASVGGGEASDIMMCSSSSYHGSTTGAGGYPSDAGSPYASRRVSGSSPGCGGDGTTQDQDSGILC